MSRKRAMNETITVEDGIVIEAHDRQENINSPFENEDSNYENLFDAVQEIRKRTNVFGYILRNDSKATVDINDPEKIIEYALLSSQTFETAETLAETFKLGDTENIVVEGKNLKMLCLRLGHNKISLFMEKGTDHTVILSVLAPQLE